MQSICIIKKNVFFFLIKSQVSDYVHHKKLNHEKHFRNAYFY